MTGKRALVTGATGTIGPDLVRYLLKQGWQVTTFSRRTDTAGLLPENVRHISGDITDVESVTKAVAGQDVVFHLAAMLHIENPSPELAEQYHRVNVIGAKIVAEAAQKSGVKRFVYFSTVKIYGVNTYPPLDESTTPNPATHYAKTKLEGEDAVRSVNGLDVTILRLSAVYGERLQGSWRRLASGISHGLFIPIGNLNNRRSLTYVDDVAIAAGLVAENPSAINRTFNLVGHDSVTMREILAAMYSATSKKMPPVQIPAGMVIMPLRLADWLFTRFGKRLPINPESIYQLVNDETYSSAALRELGFTPSVALADGWKKVLSAQ